MTKEELQQARDIRDQAIQRGYGTQQEALDLLETIEVATTLADPNMHNDRVRDMKEALKRGVEQVPVSFMSALYSDLDLFYTQMRLVS